MIKRLVDEQSLANEDRPLADLFRSAARYEPAPFRKRRVLLGVERARARGPRKLWLRPVAAALLLATGSAAAAFGYRALPKLLPPQPSLAAPSALTPRVSPPRSAGPARRESAAVDPAPALSPTTPQSEQLPPAAPSPSAASAASAVTPVPAVKGGSRARPEAAEDATGVVQAIQALRTEHDPARAQSLLNDYLKAQPRGALSGDALALSIEAASAQNDPRAADYARRYLSRFPNGKYRELAQRALDKRR